MSNRHNGGNTTAKRVASSKAKRSQTKQRVTFTLSPQSVEFLHRFKEHHNSSSLSASLDKLIESAMRARALDALNANVSAYYNSLSSAEMQDESAWGDVGAEGLAALESESKSEIEPAATVRARS
jgi:hypothetical protein